MAVKIRLKRMGKIRAPYYRVVVMDARSKRDGRAIEEIGKYHPTEHPSLIDISSERARHWLTRGAQPTEAVQALLRKTGDWQRFTGQGGGEGTLQVASPGAPKKERYEAAVAAAGASLDTGRTAGAAARRRSTEPAAERTPEASPEPGAAPASAPDTAGGDTGAGS